MTLGPPRRVLLSEASSLSAREFLTVLGRAGVDVEVVTASRAPIARFSQWCRGIHRAPAPSVDPAGYLRAVDELMATGRFDALLPTHDQAWLFAVGRALMNRSPVAVADADAFERVQSKIACARTIDAIGLPQPAWHVVRVEEDLGVLGFPVWVKAAFSTAGRGVRLARDAREAADAWRALGADEVMVQAPAAGRYAQVQGVFDRGRLAAAAVSERLATGAGGSAAARVSVDHPLAVDALARLGEHLDWHGGLCLDYLHRDGAPEFIECNTRITEPGNAAAAGVDLPGLMATLAAGEPAPVGTRVTGPGVHTRSTMAIALGAAETVGTRRGIVRACMLTVGRPAAREVLTPVLDDPPSSIPFLVGTGRVLLRPRAVARLAGAAVSGYGVTPDAVERLRRALPA